MPVTSWERTSWKGEDWTLARRRGAEEIKALAHKREKSELANALDLNISATLSIGRAISILSHINRLDSHSGKALPSVRQSHGLRARSPDQHATRYSNMS